MSLARLWIVRLGFITLTLSLISFATIGGCPQAQQPGTLPTDNGQGDTTTPTDTTPPDQGRPIPGPPTDTGQDTGGGTSGGTSGSTGGTGVVTQPIVLLITAPQETDLNLAPGAQASISYQAFGGNPADGAIAVTLFYDKDGLDGTGDERVVSIGLPPQGTEHLSTAGIASGTYYLGLRAANAKQQTTAYASGRLVVVGPPKVALVLPTANQVVRPDTAVPLQFSIDSLAASISYTVFVDRDTLLNGNEIAAFTGGGLSGTGTIFTEGFAAGVYYIGVTVSDSTGQAQTFYLSGTGGLRTITVDLAPKISVLSPTLSQIVQPGDKIDVNVQAEDPEGAATVKVFRDAADAMFNGNEQDFAQFALTSRPPPPTIFATQFDTTGLPPGTYHLGASISDGVGNPIAAYAPGTVRINAVPVVTIDEPKMNVTVQAGTAVTVKWKATDLENKLREVNVLLALDANGDGLPDGNWSTLVTLVPPQVLNDKSTSYNIDTSALLGRYLVAVTAKDDVGAVGQAVATGAIIVSNQPPVVTISAPTAREADRPGAFIIMDFFVSDRERTIKPQPDGIQVVIARDDDCDGRPDGPPVYSESDAFFWLGENFYFFDTQAIADAGLLDAGGNGCFMLGVRVEDAAGNVTIVYAPGGLLIDSVVPTIELVDPADHHIQLKPGTLTLKVRTHDTSPTTFSVRLDTNAIPGQGGPNEPQLVPPTPAPAGDNDFDINIDTATLPVQDGLYAYRLFIADAVAPTEETYVPDSADQADFAALRKLCVTDGSFVTITQPAAAVGARPGMLVAVNFSVAVCDPALKPQPDGIKVILARDDDGDGLPDGDPVYTKTSPTFGPGANTFNLDATDIKNAGLLDAGGNARFVVGVETQDMIGSIIRTYGSPVLIDSVVPTVVLVEPAYQTKPIVVDRSITTLTIKVQITDTSTDALTIILDRDNDPMTTSPDDILVADKVEVAPGTPSELTFTVNFNDPVDAPRALGLYYVYVSVADGLDPAAAWYGPSEKADQTNTSKLTRVNVRDRLVGDFYLDTLETPPETDPPLGAILQGYQFNDLAGSSMTRVPDLNGDGVDELLVGARYGKPYLIETNGVGFGEAYLIYGGQRLQGAQSVNAVGRGDIDGLLFPGIRIPLNTTWTQGLSDVGFIPDMDGDDKPELVFSFPRVEALSIQVDDPSFQHPELFPDIPNAGNYEYNALGMFGWEPNTSQFVRGGIVIVSSQNTTITNSAVLNRKGDRILDLAEVGQLFGSMQEAQIVPYIKAVVDDMPARGTINCTPPPGLSQDPTKGACCKAEGGCEELTAADCAALPRPGVFQGVGIGCNPDPCTPDIREFPRKVVLWDTVLDNQGPGGFLMPWTAVPVDPPLTNPSVVSFPTMTPPWVMFYFDHAAECDNLCEWWSTWYVWPPCPFGPMPCTQVCPPAWDAGMVSVWTGFYGPFTNITNLTVGARILGQDAEDRFGTSVASDGEFLYIAAPRHTALKSDDPSIPLIADTPAKGDDVQLIAVGHHANVNDIIVRVGPNGVLDSPPRGDDVVVDIIVGGPDNNGVADSTALAGDVQVAAVGSAVTDGALIVSPGSDFTLTSVPAGDDIVVDAIAAVAHNTVCNTPKTGDDVQRVAVNAAATPGTVLITAGADGALNTTPTNDDVVSRAIFEPPTGGNGRCNTAKQGDDVQVVALNAVAAAGALLIAPGPNGILDTTATADDVIQDVIIQPGNTCVTAAQGDDVQRVALGAAAPAGTVIILAGPNKVLDTVIAAPSGYGQKVSVIVEPIPAVDTTAAGDDIVMLGTDGQPMTVGHLTTPGQVIILPGPDGILQSTPGGDDRVEQAIIQPSPDRIRAGVIYQMRVNTRSAPSERNKAQLWLEPGMTYPNPDAQFPGRIDWTMPLPHQYIIETIGSLRGNYTTQIKDLAGGDSAGCPPAYDPGLDQAQADACTGYTPYDINTAGDIVDRVNQIVGPHADAQISFVRSVGDVNDDGVPDFAVGADTIRSDFMDPFSPVVGAVFIVFSRPTGAQGDYLLEKIALPTNDPARLRGVLLKGQTGEKLARVFDGAGDVNGDGIADVIVGNENGNGGTGEAIVILGSRTLASPAGGYTVDSIVAAGRAIWLKGTAAGDLAGANVAGAGDVDGDGYGDILIAAPGAVDPNDPTSHPGLVYLVYGSPQLPATINLADVGTPLVPGVQFVGRVDGDALGGGTATILETDPSGGSTDVASRGVTKLGDLDGDGLADYGISAILANPFQQYHAGEMYVIYGKGE